MTFNLPKELPFFQMEPFDKKPKYPSLITSLLSISSLSPGTINHIGLLLTNFHSRSYHELKSLTTNQYLSVLAQHYSSFTALGIVLPVHTAPDIAYMVILEIAKCEHFVTVPHTIQIMLLLNLVRASALLGKSEELFQLHLLQTLYQNNQAHLLLPLLYLSAQAQKPISVQLNKTVFTRNHRYNCLLLYYHGINCLLLGDFRSAELSLLEAFTLTKFCKDMRESVLQKLSLASFLNHTPYSVLCSHLPEKHQPSGYAFNIWSLDGQFRSVQSDKFYAKFSQLINIEHARRVIIDYAHVTTRMNLEDLYRACDTKSIKPILERIPDLQYEIQDQIIIFKDISLEHAISQEIAKITKSLKAQKK